MNTDFLQDLSRDELISLCIHLLKKESSNYYQDDYVNSLQWRSEK